MKVMCILWTINILTLNVMSNYNPQSCQPDKDPEYVFLMSGEKYHK